MSRLQQALGDLRDRLREGASTPATYREKNGAELDVNILVKSQELKEIRQDGIERTLYERTILVPSDEISNSSYSVPHAGAVITYTDQSGREVKAEVNNDSDGQCYRLTKSNGFWFCVFTKELV